MLDGVFSETRPEHLAFHPAPLPSDEDVAHVLATVRTRVGRLIACHHLDPADDTAPPGSLADASPVLAGLASASIQGRVHLRADGRVLITPKTVWRDGISHLLFEPIEFPEKLAAIIPRPAVNLVVYHGLLAPHARWRSRVVSYASPAPDLHARERETTPRAAGTPGA